MKIIIDQEKCIGCDLCNEISGGAMGIKYGKDGKAGQNPQTDLTDQSVVEKVKLAMQTCPVQAISLED
jgi:ferredoxin